MSQKGIRLRRAREAYDCDEPERQTITTSPSGNITNEYKRTKNTQHDVYDAR